MSAAGLQGRVANAIWDAFFGRDVTPRYYRPLADVSQATATNDLAAAVSAGLLRPEGKGRSRTYRAGDTLYQRVGAAVGLRVETTGEAGQATIIGELSRRTTEQGSR